jgi:CelD/BcsL family acetyltransferase involved in cellulose biosynthesis
MTSATPTTPITSFEEVRQQWQELLGRSVVNNLYITPAWQELWWGAFHNGRSLAGFYLTDAAGQLTGLASLSRWEDKFSFVGNSDTFDYNDFVIARGMEAAFFPALLDEIDSGGGRQLDLYSVGEDSPTLATLPDLARERGYAVDIAEEDVAPRIDLPATWDDYLAMLSKKDRHELRRKMRRLEGHENWRWFCVSDPGEASERTDTFLNLMRDSDPAKAEFLTSDREDFFRKLIAATAEEGALQLFFMEMDDKPVAASLCLDYDGVRMLYNSGHDTDYRYYSVGLLLHALCLRDALERGYRCFDFLRGNEPYKYRLGGRDHHLYRITLRRTDALVGG